jgi:hypothetical protein
MYYKEMHFYYLIIDIFISGLDQVKSTKPDQLQKDQIKVVW